MEEEHAGVCTCIAEYRLALLDSYVLTMYACFTIRNAGTSWHSQQPNLTSRFGYLPT